VIAPRYAMRAYIGLNNSRTGYMSSDGPNDSFYFRQFRQGLVHLRKIDIDLAVLDDDRVGFEFHVLV
jgi:hypothetical protein